MSGPQQPNEERKRIATRIRREALHHVRKGHPWIYDDAIESLSHEGRPGDLAVIFDEYRRFAAIGLYDPASPIRIKVLHAGKPTTIDERFWRERVAAAIEIRRPLINSLGTKTATTGYRVINGENDGFPGLVLDRYEKTLVLKLYSEAWFTHLDTLVATFTRMLGPERIVLRLARSIGDAHETLRDGTTIVGPAPTEPVHFLENGLRFEADVVVGQKTGHFLDQRENRQLLREHTNQRSVLDVFASTGGFTVYAAAGGAREVRSVDLSAPTLAIAKRNLAHNLASTAATSHTNIFGDAFGVMAGLRSHDETFDIVVVDPPSFAQRQADVASALNAYVRLAELAVKLVRPGGLLVQCSCSSRVSAEAFFDAVHEGAARGGASLHEHWRTGHALDHPVTFPEGAYLKALFATVG